MASELIKRFVRLCLYLQEPHHVAKFQQLCGVRGTFPRKSAGTEDGELSPNGACMKQCPNESTGEEYTGEQKTEDLRQRKNANTRSLKQDECSNALVNGVPTIPGAGEVAGQEADCLKESSPKSGVALMGDSPKLADSDSEVRASRGRVKPLRKNSLTGDGGQEFIIENKFLFYLFTFGTELGNEMFFIVFFPFLIWNVDAFVSRRLIVVWVWVLFLGQSTKDLVRWTRPASPPVVKVEVFYNSEYSMPSTHAMSGTALPFSLFLLTYGRWEEVISGFLYSVLILAVFLPALDSIDGFYLRSPLAPALILLLHVGLGLVAFSLDSWSTSRGDTAQALATGAGAALASHLNHRLALLPDPPPSQLPLAPPALGAVLLGRALLRLLVGVGVLLAVRAAMKAAAIPLACRVAGVPSGDVRQARQHAAVELPYRYLVYGAVGFSCVFLVPLLFSHLGLS